MLSLVILALVGAASAQFVHQQYPHQQYPYQQYPYQQYYGGYNGVNPIVPQYPVPHVQQNNYRYVNQDKVIPTTYGYNGYAAKTAAFAAPAVEYSRDFNIEPFGEKYAYQSGPATFQYQFVKGQDKDFATVPAVSTFGQTNVATYGVPHHDRVQAVQPFTTYGNNYYGQQYAQPITTAGSFGFAGKLRTSSPVVPKFDTYSAKDLIAH